MFSMEFSPRRIKNCIIELVVRDFYFVEVFGIHVSRKIEKQLVERAGEYMINVTFIIENTFPTIRADNATGISEC